jgi:hypothetical protein
MSNSLQRNSSCSWSGTAGMRVRWLDSTAAGVVQGSDGPDSVPFH